MMEKDSPVVVLRTGCKIPVPAELRTSMQPNEKLIYFVRHAEGEHNAAAKNDYSAYLREDLFDAALTQFGEAQCFSLSEKTFDHVTAELLVVSPLTRTMSTAVLGFPHLMNSIPWIALEALRERTGRHHCDKRRSISQNRLSYPMICFDHMENDEDLLFSKFNDREPEDHIALRGVEFLQWLAKRPEKEIVVVSHDGFLRTLFTKCFERQQIDQHFTKFENCEMRAVLISVV